MTDTPTTDAAAPTASAVIDGMTEVLGEAAPATVFSAPERVGDSAVITAASWERVGGFGFADSARPAGEQGGGGGGGGASQGRPVAVIRIGADGGVVVSPVVDLTKIAVTALLSALGVWRVLRLARPPR